MLVSILTNFDHTFINETWKTLKLFFALAQNIFRNTRLYVDCTNTYQLSFRDISHM
jgi:hypothetical protein